ncbi:PEP-CTERM sorting domain-containing protein [bacterium]|nr:PEP-CTERM sorting domain-containing protein [bacterium]
MKRQLLLIITTILVGMPSIIRATSITPADFSAFAITIGFDTYPDGTAIPGIIVPPFSGMVTNPNAIIDFGYAESGVIFSSPGGGVAAVGQDTSGQLNAISSPNVVVAMTSASEYSASAPIYIDFVCSITGMPSFTTMVGAYARDVDTQPVPFVAYDAAGVQLGQAFFPVVGNGGISFAGLTFGGAAIARVEINAAGVDSIGIDNLRFEPVGTPVGTVVPEPSTIILLGTGLLGMVRMRRRCMLK